MVTYRTISVELRSQFGLQAIPEYPSVCSKQANADYDGSQDMNSSNTPPSLVPDVSTYIPIYPSSQFWIYYSISPPYPPSAYFYFKLFVNGEHIVSWGCGEEEGYHGKAMYALYQDSSSGNSTTGPRLEKRLFFFTSPKNKASGINSEESKDRTMEIRVYRSKGRKRIERSTEPFDKAKMAASKGVDLVLGGTYERLRTQKYYKYYLVDPADQPFATFRFFYRTWDELCALGVIPDNPKVAVKNSSDGLQSRLQEGDGKQECVVDTPSSKFSENCNAWGEGRTSQEFDFRQLSPSASRRPKSNSKRLSFPPSIVLSPRGQKARSSHPEIIRPLPPSKDEKGSVMSAPPDQNEDSLVVPRPATPPRGLIKAKAKLPAVLLLNSKKRSSKIGASFEEEEELG